MMKLSLLTTDFVVLTNDRFMKKVQQADGCWPWSGKPSHGYGRFSFSWEGEYITIGAHQWAHFMHTGEDTNGLDVDHRCHDPRYCRGGERCPHRLCVRGDHLKAVPRGENVSAHRSSIGQAHKERSALITHCPQGHPYAGDNLRVTKRGGRICIICQRAAVNKWAARDREMNGSRWNRAVH